MKIATLFVLLFYCHFGFAQETAKSVTGVTPIEKVLTDSSITYAIVVGISDYQNDGISDLHYADKDALAFATWLSTNAGYTLKPNNLKLLINQSATMAAFGGALDWLIEVCKPNDRAIIYFSGHGDVETMLDNQPGNLLCYDAPSRGYTSGGTIILDRLQTIINTLSKTNVKVVAILDACHAGILAGSSINGSQRANANLSKQIARETKILSCGENEFSLEGEQWGGGRGVFSYHLVNGLYGLADKNHDNSISLLEIRNYLEENILKDVAPRRQVPEIKGDITEIISKVDPDIRDSILFGSYDYLLKFSMIETKLAHQDELFNRDSLVKKMYSIFYKLIKEKKYFSPKDNCAEYYYQKLLSSSEVQEFHNALTRNYAVALQEDAQQIINQILNNEVYRIGKSGKDALDEYKLIPSYLARASELLGKNHYYYNTLKSNEFLFRGIVRELENRGINNEQENLARLSLYQQSLNYNDKNPICYFYLNRLFAEGFQEKDSCDLYYRKLKAAMPSWVLANAYYGFYLTRYFEEYEQAKVVLEEGMIIDSKNVFLLNSLGSVYFYQKDYEKAIDIFEKAVKIDPNYAQAWCNLGSTFHEKGEFLNSEKAFTKSIELNPNQTNAYNGIAWLFHQQKMYNKAEANYKIGLSKNQKNIPIRIRLSILYLDQRLFKLADEQVLNINQLDEGNYWIHFYQACKSALKSDNKKALEFLKLAFENNFDDFELFSKIDYFDALKNDNRFLDLIKTYNSK
jgi:tetratricopeptide (TPR) repeat protein